MCTAGSSEPRNASRRWYLGSAPVLLGGADQWAEVGEQQVDGVRLAPPLLQPHRVGPLGAQPVQRLPAEVVLPRVEVGGRRDALRPGQQGGDVAVAPEPGHVEGALRRAVHGEPVAPPTPSKADGEVLGEDLNFYQPGKKTLNQTDLKVQFHMLLNDINT